MVAPVIVAFAACLGFFLVVTVTVALGNRILNTQLFT